MRKAEKSARGTILGASRVRRRKSIALLAAAAMLATRDVGATDLYWGVASGTWRTPGNWSLNPTGTPLQGAEFPDLGDDLVFFNGSGVNGNETVSLDDATLAFGMTFSNTGSTTIQGNGSGPWAIDLGTGGLSVAAGAGAVTIGSVTAGNEVNLTHSTLGTRNWTNAGTLTLVNVLDLGVNALTLNTIGTTNFDGAVINNSSFTINKGATAAIVNVTNTFSDGTLTNNGGNLKLSGNGAMATLTGVTLANRGIIELDNTVTNLGNRIAGNIASSGGTINFIANAAATTETLGALTLNAGALTINSATGAGGSTLTIPSITRTVAGGTLFVSGTGLGGGTNRVVLTGAPALTQTILPWSVVSNGTVARFATHGGNGTSLAPQTTAASYQATEASWTVNTVNALPAASQAMAANRIVHSLTLDNGVNLTAATSDRSLTIGSGSIGAILQSGGTSTIGNTSLDAILEFQTREAVFHVLGTLQTLRQDSTSGLRGSGGLTKSGPGTLILGGQSTLTGTYRLNEGILEARRGDALGATQPLQINGGTFRLSEDVDTSFSSTITLNADATIQVDRVTAAATTTTHTVGAVSLAARRTLLVTSSDITSGTGYGLTTGAFTLAGAGSTINVANNDAGTGTMTVASMAGAFTLTKTGAGDLLASTGGFSGTVDIQAGRIGWSGGGTVNQGQTFTGAGGILQAGVGITNITGTNTFIGAVSVAGGTLQFSTVTNSGGGASNLGSGTTITTGGGNLAFIGGASQSTNRSVSLTSSGTLTANGTSGASITYSGAFTASGTDISLTLDGNEIGVINGSLAPTTGAGDIVKNGTSTWTLSAATITDDLLVNAGVLNLNGSSPINDDVVVTNANAVLNLNAANSHQGDDLFIRAGATVNLGIAGALSSAGMDALLISDSGATGTSTLDLKGFVSSVNAVTIGTATLDGKIVDTVGTGVLTTGSIALNNGLISADLALSGASTVTKASASTATISGTNTFGTGGTVLSGGNLILDFTTENVANSKINSAASLTGAGGTITLNGNTGAATSQAVTSLLLTGGANLIDVNNGAGHSITFGVGSITRAVNTGTVRFELPSTGSITTTAANNNATTAGILGGWATVTDATGTFFARNSSGSIVAANTTTQNNVSLWVNGDNVTDAGGGYTGSIADFALVNSLRFNAVGPSTVTIGGGAIHGISTGGVLATSNVTAGIPSITGGRLISGTQELILTNDSAHRLTVASALSANNTITKTVTGTVALTSTANASGNVLVQSGTLMTSGTGIGDSASVTLSAVQPSTLQITGNETIGLLAGGSITAPFVVGTVDITAGNTLTVRGGDVFAGTFSGSGTLVKNSALNTTNMNLTGNTTTGFTGSVIVDGGLFQLSGATARLSSATAFTINKSGNILIDNDDDNAVNDRLADSAAFTLNSADGTFGGATPVRGLGIRTDNNGNETETIGVLTFGSGASYFYADASGGTSAIAGILTSNFVRTNNATVNARGRALGTAATIERSQLRISDATNQTAFIGTVDNANLVGGGGAAGTKVIDIVPWAMGETTTGTLVDTNMGNSLVTYVSGAGFRPLDLTTEYNTFATKTTVTDNIRESLSANLAGLSGTTLNALVLHNSSAAAASISVTGTGAGQTLQVTSGAMLFTRDTAGAGDYAITIGGFGGGITMGGAGITNEYVIHVINPDSASLTKTLTATITSPLTSAADITKSGRGILELTGNNTAGGGARKTTINEGTLLIADLENIGGGTGGLVFAGGVLRLDSAFDVGTDDLSTRAISFLPGGGTLDTNGLNPTFANSLGSGSGGFTKIGVGNLTLNAATAHLGATNLAEGSITLGVNQAISTGPLTVSAVLAMDANNATVSALTTNAGASITGGGILTVSIGNATLNAGAVAPVLAGTMNLIAPANATVTIGNTANTYTGYTHIQQGTLSVLNVANAGVASAIGAPVAGDNAPIRLGNVATTGTLLIAAAGTGGTTDRPIWLMGTTGGGVIDNDGTAALILNGDIKDAESGSKTVTLQGASTSFNNVLNGNVVQRFGTIGLTKAEAGTWILTGANTYTGSTSVAAGAVRVQNASALGTAAGATSITAGANLRIENVNIGAEPLNLNGAGIASTGALTATGVAANSGVVTLVTTSSVGIAASGDQLTLSGAIGGTGGLTKVGAGTLILSGAAANTYSGLTTVLIGVLDLNKTPGFDAIVGDGVGSKITPDVLLNGGTLRLQDSNQLGDSVFVNMTAGTFNVNGKSDTIFYFANSGGTYNSGRGGGLTIVDPVWSGGINNVFGNDFYGGAIDPALEISGGTNIIHGDEGTGGGAGSVTVGSSSSALRFSGATPNLTVSGDHVAAGRLILLGSVNVNAGTSATITSGPALLSDGVTVDANQTNLIKGKVDLGNANRIFTVGAGGSLGVSAVIQSSGGGLTKDGAGTMTVTAANTYTGPTSITAGTLVVNGSLASATEALTAGTVAGTGSINGPLTISAGGSVRPGDPNGGVQTGVLTVASLAMANSPTAVMGVKLNGKTAGSEYDQVALPNAAGSTVSIAGASLAVKLGAFFAGDGSEKFYVINNQTTGTGNAVTGTFAALIVETDGGFGVPTGNTLNSPTASEYIPGGVDFTDPNTGFVYTLAYSVDSLTNNLTPGSGNDVVLSVVPEPATAGLLAMACLGLLARRRRRTGR